MKSLHDAARLGDLESVRRQIEAGVDLDEKEPIGGSTALIVASTFGQLEIVEALVEAGADLDLVDNHRSTALYVGALFCRTEIVAFLLERGADRGTRNSGGWTAHEFARAPFEQVAEIYDFLRSSLGQFGVELDEAHLQATRPKIAKLLE